MNAIRFARLLLLSFVVSGFSVKHVASQEPKAEGRIAALESRLEQIENRLSRIENVLFATIKYSEAEARVELDRAKESLAHSERLHAQGLISAMQLKLDQMSLERANTLVKMCIDHEDHRRIGATLDVFDAKQLYERERLNLQRAERLHKKGFVGRDEVTDEQAKVMVAGRKLKLAETRLKELKESLESKPSTGKDDNKDKQESK